MQLNKSGAFCQRGLAACPPGPNAAARLGHHCNSPKARVTFVGMPKLVATTAPLACTFGTAPSALTALLTNRARGYQPADRNRRRLRAHNQCRAVWHVHVALQPAGRGGYGRCVWRPHPTALHPRNSDPLGAGCGSSEGERFPCPDQRVQVELHVGWGDLGLGTGADQGRRDVASPSQPCSGLEEA
jgi:hypothetical protein